IRDTVPLSAIDPGIMVKISAISATDTEMMKYIDQLDLKPDNTCRVMSKAPFDGPLTILVNGKNVAIAASLASMIEVEILDSQQKTPLHED
ncbi:MAG: ferrous iron transport protein A, partial [Chlorobiales bacterium]|nr:ferrous iron transport protein A [Chlorobiales bacterium]